MDDSNVNVLSLTGQLMSVVGNAIGYGMGPDDVNAALAAVQQLVSQVSPSEQKKTGTQPGTAPRK